MARFLGALKRACCYLLFKIGVVGVLLYHPNVIHPHDFISPSGDVVELKTRRCNKDRYPDTMIGANKIQNMLSNSDRSYCVFSFTDGSCFVEITPDNVSKFRRGSGGRSDRGQIEQQQYYFIPVNLLSPL